MNNEGFSSLSMRSTKVFPFNLLFHEMLTFTHSVSPASLDNGSLEGTHLTMTPMSLAKLFSLKWVWCLLTGLTPLFLVFRNIHSLNIAIAFLVTALLVTT